jgi:ATP-binding cassette subfamily F protein 3
VAAPAGASTLDREGRKRQDAERRKQQKARDALQRRIAELEARIGVKEAEVKDLEAAIGAAGFYDNHDAAKTVIGRHQALMWEVGDLMAQWESLQEHAAELAPES